MTSVSSCVSLLYEWLALVRSHQLTIVTHDCQPLLVAMITDVGAFFLIRLAENYIKEDSIGKTAKPIPLGKEYEFPKRRHLIQALISRGGHDAENRE